MGRKCFVSFKTEDLAYKNWICENPNIDMIDKSLHERIDSYDSDYVIRRIREDYLSDSTVTIHLIGQHSAEAYGPVEQEYIKRELQASLYNGEVNKRNGILGVVLPSMYSAVYGGSSFCLTCGRNHNQIYVNDSTTIKEFSYNYYIPHNKCAWSEEDRYCVLVRWSDFTANPEAYIEQAFAKRFAPIADKTRVYP
ncbi:TIR domain-containing protein [Flavisolibacter sp. BT320]|nr:TIR domain-containing protein [Flavisolibacter longurius]